MARYVVALLVILLLAYHFLDARPIQRPPGVLAPEAPVQEIVKDGPSWEIGDYEVHALARFELEARVLSAERYRFDREADLSPIDLALGWGPMSANAVIDSLDISQGGRFFHWWSSEPMIAPGEITRHSANMHMVPARLRRARDAARRAQRQPRAPLGLARRGARRRTVGAGAARSPAPTAAPARVSWCWSRTSASSSARAVSPRPRR